MAGGFVSDYISRKVLCHPGHRVGTRTLFMQFKMPRAGETVPQTMRASWTRGSVGGRPRPPISPAFDEYPLRLGSRRRLRSRGRDIITAALAVRIIMTARRLGAQPALLRRMAGNAAIDAAIGLVPVIGAVFDVFYRRTFARRTAHGRDQTPPRHLRVAGATRDPRPSLCAACRSDNRSHAERRKSRRSAAPLRWDHSDPVQHQRVHCRFRAPAPRTTARVSCIFLKLRYNSAGHHRNVSSDDKTSPMRLAFIPSMTSPERG